MRPPNPPARPAARRNLLIAVPCHNVGLDRTGSSRDAVITAPTPSPDAAAGVSSTMLRASRIALQRGVDPVAGMLG